LHLDSSGASLAAALCRLVRLFLRWTEPCPRPLTGHPEGSTDTASGVNHYEYRVSTNAGTTWGATVSAASVTLSATGSYVVQFRAVDNVGLASAWAPTVNGAANSACLT